ncbi:MAG: hypothetical protein ACREF1_07370 [Acetobacteraceae bacterium]
MGARPMLTVLACLLVGACAAPKPPIPAVSPGWTVRMNLDPLADVGGGGGGRGTITFDGQAVAFRTGGLGVYGAQVALVAAVGQVQGLARLDDFAGRYRADGTALDRATGTRDLYLRNQRGVRLHLRAAEPGTQMPALGSDAVDITLGRG